MCEDKRRQMLRKKRVTSSQCMPQRLAYCMQVVEAPSMSRQHVCVRTMESCQSARAYLVKAFPKLDYVTQCQPMQNTDPYTGPKDFVSQRALE